MSEMEVFYGVFKRSFIDVDISDTDEFYDLEEEHKCHYVKVRGLLFTFFKVKDLDPCGFSTLLGDNDEWQSFIVLWYNGGAGVHEVVGNLIEDYLGDCQ